MSESWIEIAHRGFRAWAEKPHNKKWASKIDWTPIPNDLPIVVGEGFKEAVLASNALDELAKHPEWELSHDSPLLSDDPEEAFWVVRRVAGINDRTWTEIASGPTPVAALQAAIERSGT